MWLPKQFLRTHRTKDQGDNTRTADRVKEFVTPTNINGAACLTPESESKAQCDCHERKQHDNLGSMTNSVGREASHLQAERREAAQRHQGQHSRPMPRVSPMCRLQRYNQTNARDTNRVARRTPQQNQSRTNLPHRHQPAARPRFEAWQGVQHLQGAAQGARACPSRIEGGHQSGVCPQPE